MARQFIRKAIAAAATIGAALAANAQTATPSGAIPDTGTADYIFRTGQGACLVAEATVRAGVMPYLREGPCRDAIVLTAHFLGRAEARIEVGAPGQCATAARGVIFGAPRIDILPCNGALDQRFRIETSEMGFRLRTSAGDCWTRRGPVNVYETDFVLIPCRDGERTQYFSVSAPRSASVTPPVRVAPAKAIPVAPPRSEQPAAATPVAPPTEARPEGLPATAPMPGFYALATRDPQQCLGIVGLDDDPNGTANLRIRMSRCEDRWSMNFELKFVAGRGFLIVPMNEPDVCATLPRMASEPRRVWVAVAQCTVANDQLFAIEQIGFGEFVTIKTLSGLCLTVRGNLRAERSEENNSGLFPEPCRSTVDQNFKLGRIERR